VIRQLQKTLISGLPEGLSFTLLDELCREHLDRPLLRVAHTNLTVEANRSSLAWKDSLTYRLHLTAERDRTWTLLYKNTTYRPERVPAVAELGNPPGSPEYWVYTKAQASLARFLPEAYYCQEVSPGKQYKYLLEDLDTDYQNATTPQITLMVAAELGTFHRLLGQWAKLSGQGKLLSYDRNFSTALREQAQKTFERFSRRSVNTTVNEITRLWPKIAKVHNNPEFYAYQALKPIHGDFYCANILRRTAPIQVKVLDWEWAGLGVAHMDLVTLLRKATPELETQVLAIYARQNPELTLEEHTRLYRWCQLERGLFHATYLANQQMDTSSKRFFTMPKSLEEPLQQMLTAYYAVN